MRPAGQPDGRAGRAGGGYGRYGRVVGPCVPGSGTRGPLPLKIRKQK